MSLPTDPQAPVYRKATIGEHWRSLSRNARWSIAATVIVLGLGGAGATRHFVTSSKTDGYLARARPVASSDSTNTELLDFRDFICADYGGHMTADQQIKVIEDADLLDEDEATLLDFMALMDVASASC